MSEIYHISDLHFSHNNEKVYGPRGFSSAGEMNENILRVLRETLRPGDRLINYGDNAIEGTWEDGLRYMRSLPCDVELRIGNHDRVFPGKRDSHRFFREYAEVFTNIQLFQRAKLDGMNYIQAHMPYWPNDRHEPRLRQWRAVNDGLPIVHGHTHSVERHEFPRSLNVAWDAWQRPVSHGEVLDWLRTVQ